MLCRVVWARCTWAGCCCRSSRRRSCSWATPPRYLPRSHTTRSCNSTILLFLLVYFPKVPSNPVSKRLDGTVIFCRYIWYRDLIIARVVYVQQNNMRNFYAIRSGSPFGATMGVGCVLCLESDCANGGHCADVRSSYDCSCPPGYDGDYCQVNTVYCMP